MSKCTDCIHGSLCFKQLTRKKLTPNGFELYCADFVNGENVVEVVRCKDCIYFTKDMAVGMCYRVPDKPLIPCVYDNFCKFGSRR